MEEIEANYALIKKWLNDHNVVLPFYLRKYISSNPLMYEPDEDGELVGETVQVFGQSVNLMSGVEQIIEPMIGVITAHAHDSVVVYLTGADLYLGWLEEDEYRLIDMFIPPVQKQLH